MKYVAALVLCLHATVSVAQETDDPLGEGASLMQQGAELLLRGLMEEMQPALDDLQELSNQIGPVFEGMTAEMAAAFAALMAKLDSMTYYELPEILPNGDIIIRRSPDAPPWKPPLDTPLDL